MMRLALFLTMIVPSLGREALVWQPVIDYTMSFPGDRVDAAPIINPFENFTHLATDFGWMGPGSKRIDAKGGIIRVKPGKDWAGAWHSLAGLASQTDRKLDLNHLIEIGDDPEHECTVRAISMNAFGRGTVQLELADASRKVLWSTDVVLDSETTKTWTVPVDPAKIGYAKFLNWTCQGPGEVQISSIGFQVDRPEFPIEDWAFRISLAKLRRCHDPASGLTRDRGHTPAGTFDTIAATGMHALASAAAVAEGLLDRTVVLQELETTLGAVEALPKAGGVLPHFFHRNDAGVITIVPGTEFSTIDSAIALHGLLLATRILGDADLNQRVVKLIRRIDFDAITDEDGWISHGYETEGKSLLGPVWRDWGGETALVLALEAMAESRTPRGRMSPSGEPYRGTGFIAEIQSLFYPDFDRPEADAVSGISWPKVRKQLLSEQMGYLSQHWPESAAAKAGLFGISAGEAGMPGAGYSANGVEVMGVRWLYPHYMVMGPGLNDPEIYRKTLEKLQAAQLLYPFGLPENIEVDLRLHNPMNGGLNASFEALAAYHGWRKRGTPENHIDTASQTEPLARQAASRFYPGTR